MSSRKPLPLPTKSTLTQLQDRVSSKPSKAKGKEKVTEPEQSATGADTTRDGEDRDQSERSPTAEEQHGYDAKVVGSSTLMLSESQAWKPLDPTKYPHVLQLFDNSRIRNNPGAYFLFIETHADGSTKAHIRGPFDANSKSGSPNGITSPRAESSGIKDIIPAGTMTHQDNSGVRLNPSAKNSTSDHAADTGSGATPVERPRACYYTAEQYKWMNDWCRENRSTSHRDAKMAAAFEKKFGFPRTPAAMKARFQAFNESGHLEGLKKTLKFYQDRANEPKKRKDDQRARRSQANDKDFKSEIQDEDGEEDEQDSDEAMETETTKPRQGRKRGRSVMDASESIDLAEDVDMDAPQPPKKARRTKSISRPSVTRARGSHGEEEEESYMPTAKKLGPMATLKEHPPPRWSGPLLLSALPEGESASVVPPGPTNSISPDYRGRSFTAINATAMPRPAATSFFTSGGTASLAGPSSSGGKDSRRGSARDEDEDEDTDMD